MEMMLHARPEAVRMDMAEDFEPTSVELQRRFQHLLLPEGGVGFGWMSQDLLHPSGDGAPNDDLSVQSCQQSICTWQLSPPPVHIISRHGGMM